MGEGDKHGYMSSSINREKCREEEDYINFSFSLILVLVLFHSWRLMKWRYESLHRQELSHHFPYLRQARGRHIE